jgi:hypothetical protein
MDETATYISFSVPVEISEPSFDQCHHMITFVSSFLFMYTDLKCCGATRSRKEQESVWLR